MDDEEAQFVQMSEPLYRLETGNYEYRFVNLFIYTVLLILVLTSDYQHKTEFMTETTQFVLHIVFVCISFFNVFR